ncbi:MAG TPA: response regulator [Planctomycetota bacterium]|nr:response regulator [Planctomycetota bacterium]
MGPACPILLVEDNEDDVLITKRAFSKGGLANVLSVVRDGDEALDFVFRRGRFANAPRPGLILLDLNLPRVDGFTVLKALKSDPDIRSIPVIVLTTSKRDEDVLRSYSFHANSYIEKPVEFERFVEVLRTFKSYWNETATLPRPNEQPEQDAA